MIRSVSLLLVGCLLADPVAASIQGIVPPAPAPGLYTPASSPSIYNEQALEPFLNWMRQPLEWDAIRALGSSIAEAWKDFTDKFPRIEVLETETVGSFSNFPIIEIAYKMKKTTGGGGSGNITRKQETAVAKFVGDLTLEQLVDLVRIKWGQSEIQTARTVREMLQPLLQRYPDHQERLRIRAEAYRQAEALYPQRLNEAKQAFVAGLSEANLQDLVRMKLGMEDPPITSDVGERLKHLLQYYPNPLEQLGTRGDIYREAEALLAPRLTEAKQTFLAGLSESEQQELLFIKVGRDTSDTSAALRQKLNHVLQISPDPEQQFTVRADIYVEAAALIAQRIPTVVLKFLAGLTDEEIHELIMIKLGRDTAEQFAALHQKLNRLYQPYADPDQQKAVYTELYHQAYVLSAVRREGEVLKKVLAPRPGGTPRPPEVLMEVGGSLIQELATEYTSADVEGRAPLVDALALIIMIWWDEHPRESHYDQTMSREPRDRRNYIPDLVLQRCERYADPVWGVEVFTLLAEKYPHRDDVARFLVGRGNIFARSETLQKAFEPMLLEISAAHPKLLAIRIMESRSAGKSDAVNQWLDHLLLRHAEHSSVPVIVRTLLRLIDNLKLGTVTPGTLLILDTENDGPLTEVSAVERLGPKAMVAWMQSMILQIAQLSPAHKRTVVQQIEKRIQRLHQVDGEELLRRVREASTTKPNAGTWWWISDAYRETARAYGKVVGWILMPVVIEGIAVLSLSLGASSVFFHSVISTANPAVLWAPLAIWLVAHVGDPAIDSRWKRFGKELFLPGAIAVLTMIAFFVTGHFIHGPLGPGTLALIIGIPHFVVLSLVKMFEWHQAQEPPAAPAKTETTEPTPLAGPVDFFATHPVARKFPVRVTRISRANLTIELAPSTWYDGLELAQSYMTRWKTQRVSWEYSFFGRATSKEIAQFRRATALDMTFLGQPINVTALEPTMHQLYGANQRWFPIDVGFMPYVTDDRGEPAQWLALKNQGIVCLWTAFQVAVNSQDDARKRWLYVFLKEVLKLPKDVPNEALDPSITLLRGFWEKYVKNVADARDKLDKMPRPLGPQALLNQRGDALYRLHVAVNEIDPLLYRLSLAPPSLKQTAELDPKGDARKKALQTFYTTSIKLKKLGWNWEEVGSNLRLGLSHSGELLNLITLARHRYYRQADELLTTLFTSGVAAPSDILRLIHILAEYETSLTPDIEAKFELKSHHNFAKSRQDLAALRERFVALIKSVEVAPGQRWIVLGRVEIKDKKIKTPYYVVAPVKKWLLDTGMDNKDVRIVAEDDPWFAPFLPLVGASPKPVQSTLSHTHLSLMASMLLAAVLLPFYLYSTQPHPHDLHHSLKVSA